MSLKRGIIIVMFSVGSLSAQNIIPNPSFEDTILRTTPLFLPNYWVAPTVEGFNYYTPLHNNLSPNYWGIPDNINGYQVARTGSAYLGLLTYHLNEKKRSGVREYAQVQLVNPLNSDSTYCLQLYMSMADSMVFASKNQMGIYFSSNAVSSSNRGRLPNTPQIIISPDSFNTDKVNWVEYNFEYKAAGGEEYMTLGNFNDTTHLDTLFVPGGGKEFYYEASYYYFDDFYLGHCDSVPVDTSTGIKENSLIRKITVYPNPAKEQLFIQYDGKEQLQIRLYNLHGQLFHFDSAQCDNCLNQNNSQLKFSVAHLPQGLYFLEIVAGEERISKKVIIE